MADAVFNFSDAMTKTWFVLDAHGVWLAVISVAVIRMCGKIRK